MENCLVKKLKSVVNNSDLTTLGALKLNVSKKTISNINQQKLNIRAVEDIIVTAYGSGYFGTDNVSNIESQHYTTLSIPANTTTVLFFKNEDYTVEIKSKYGLFTFSNAEVSNSIVSINIDDLSYSYSLHYIAIEGTSSVGNIKELSSLTELLTLNTANTQIKGELQDISTLTTLTSLYISNCSNIKGSLSALQNMTSLQTLSFNHTNIIGTTQDLGKLTSLSVCYVNRDTMSGTIEEFVATQINGGRLSVSSPVFIGNLTKFATFGGQYYNDANCLVTWESNNKIVVYAGGTSIAACTYVYAKGATAEEIAAWEQDGKTVVVVS